MKWLKYSRPKQSFANCTIWPPAKAKSNESHENDTKGMRTKVSLTDIHLKSIDLTGKSSLAIHYRLFVWSYCLRNLDTPNLYAVSSTMKNFIKIEEKSSQNWTHQMIEISVGNRFWDTMPQPLVDILEMWKSARAKGSKAKDPHYQTRWKYNNSIFSYLGSKLFSCGLRTSF